MTVIVNVSVCSPPSLTAFIVYVASGLVTVAVPLITPVSVFKLSPFGKLGVML
ncbi:hypothetical protein D3C85_1066930 [compost metagenome]